MKFSDYIRQIEEFYIQNGIDIEPLPVVQLDKTPQDRFDPFIRTGYYDPNKRSIVLFIENRHLKDILRSFCHELIHHNQNLDNPTALTNQPVSGSLQENPYLEKMESDAYLRGNLMFRKWTEQFTM